MRKFQHTEKLHNSWRNMSFLEMMGNIGSEVERTIKWKEKRNEEYSKLSFFRSLELFWLTLDSQLTSSQIKEVARAREIWIDFVYFENEYKTEAEQWRKYFNQFIVAYRNSKNKESIKL